MAGNFEPMALTAMPSSTACRVLRHQHHIMYCSASSGIHCEVSVMGSLYHNDNRDKVSFYTFDNQFSRKK